MKREACVLAVDIGTSSLKAALIDGGGGEIAFAREVYPQDACASGTVEARHWEEAFVRALRRLGVSPRLEPLAICISGNGPTLVPLGKDGKELRPLHWHGARKAAPPASGTDAPPRSLFLPYAAAFKERQPRLYAETAHFLSPQDWLAWRLGADMVSALPSSSYIPYYWNDEQCGSYDIEIAKFPPFAEMGTPVGKLSRRGAAWGLEPGIPLIAGGPDFIMALIGTGAVRAGLVCDRAGSSEGINLCAAAPHESGKLRLLPHAKEGLWNIGAILPTSGRLFEWFRHITGQDERSYGEILEEIIQAPGLPSLPVLSGGSSVFFPDLAASGAFTSPSAFFSLAGLSSRASLGRSVVEALGFRVLGALDTFREEGFSVEELRLSGGQAKNALWNQLKADISGLTLHAMNIADGELAGDACLCLMALGEAASLDEACNRVVHIKESYIPGRELHEQYCRRYAQYKDMEKKAEGFLQ
ncbi:MAG: FGGY-family carbohydrate kinase [Spirochaetaceae bacterium]|jgi:xylulokinase|nr:FGGY-family carbohydrate kinase [Spirochaetaceae bacterium]